ncbi:MAG: alpha/beta fold hydrolase [Lachnospiraceae bacterium]|nr:alpha/beta fold hydrolase [Lachnospiraceae bacterium]
MDIPYANTTSEYQKLNLVLPNEGEGPFPVIVYIHGGGWLIGDKNHVQTQSVNRLLYAGYAVCCINYRLSDVGKWPEPLYDCKAAIRFLRANGEKYNLCTERIGVAGNSAGGHLAAMLGTTNDCPDYEDLSMGWEKESSAVQAVFTWFAPFDLTKWESDWRKTYPERGFDEEVSAEAYFFNAPLRDVPEKVRAASPAKHLSKKTVPFYVEQGTGDHAVPYCQCVDFYNEYVKVVGSETIQMKLFEGAEHSDAVFKTDENVFEFVRFFDKYIQKIPERSYFVLGTLGECDNV